MVTESTRRYEILDAVGRGAFGTVYRARAQGPEGFSKVVALKMLHPDKADLEEVVGRLRDEARMLGMLQHRAVVQADGLVRLAGRWAVVMEFVAGIDLLRLTSQVRVPAGVALEIGAEVAGALHTAYTTVGPSGAPLHLLHRDVKLANIQLTATGAVKLLDFGIARAEFTGRESETGEMHFGSELYVSPERIDYIYGPEGDVYSLAIVLFHLLMGEHFGKTSANRERHEALHRSRIDALRTSLGLMGVRDDGLVDLVRASLAYEPGDRPTAREFERRCIELRRGVSGTALRNWAETAVVPHLGTATADDSEHLVGQVLAEGSELTTLEIDIDPSPAAAGWRWPVVALAALALAGVAWATWPAPPATRGADATTDPMPVAVPAPPVVPAPVAPPAGVPEPTPVATPTQPAERPSPAAPAPRPSPPAGGTALVSGDAERVELVDGERRYGPGPVPVGTYAVYAVFNGQPPVRSGNVQVVRGGVVHIVCNTTFGRCQVQ